MVIVVHFLLTAQCSIANISGEALRPWYHFTRLEGEMNDPNGLQFRFKQDGILSYELFYQHRPSNASACWGSEGSGDVWGHASSPDLLHWRRLPLSGMCGSTGSGITLPAGFHGPNGETWMSALIASAPSMTPRDTNGTGRGLKLWTSNDTDLLKYEEYLPPGTVNIPGYHMNDACVICPAAVRPGPSNPPVWTRAADIGDSYVWSDPMWNIPSDNRTFYVLSGEGRCPLKDGIPSTFCGWAKGKEPQALLWSSKNLVDWRFIGEFYNGTRDDFTAVMTPDTFNINNTQVLIWLGSHDTLWVTGTTELKDGELYKFHEMSFGGNPSMGWEDVGGGTHCGQSEWDAKGRRIQFLWFRLNTKGANYTGAQTIPREIVLAPPGSTSGLFFRPIPEMSTLHVGEAQYTRLILTNTTQMINAEDGYHCHLTIELKLLHPTTVVLLELRASPQPSGIGSVEVEVSQGSIGIEGKHAQLKTSSEIDLEIFIDGPLIEVFANGGERALTHSTNTDRIAGMAIKASSNEVGTTLNAWVWSMSQTIT